MPYDEFGNPITVEERDKKEAFKKKHCVAGMVTLVMLIILIFLTFLAGACAILFGINILLNSGDTGMIIGGAAALIYIVSTIVLSIIFLN